jgi:hypothetical protein
VRNFKGCSVTVRSIIQDASDYCLVLSKPFDLGDGDLSHISASIGIVLYPDDVKYLSDLVKQADQAMYAAKAEGRGRFSYFTLFMQQSGLPLKLDRLARSVAHLMEITQALERKHIGMRILNLGMDTQTPTGKLLLTVLGAVAQFEREMMLERQREGVAKAKDAGKYKGRKPIPDDRRQEAVRLATEGVPKISIARQLNIGEASVGTRAKQLGRAQ